MKQGALVRRLFCVAAVTGASLATIFAVGAGTALAGPPVISVGSLPIHRVGTVDLSSDIFSNQGSNDVAGFRQGASLASAAMTGTPKIEDSAIASRRVATGTQEAFPMATVGSGQIAGESGFGALTGYDQALANHNVDLEPPDQGLCTGNGDVVDFINNAMAVYDANGTQLLNTIPSFALFKQPASAFMSDPRCWYDASTQRWFFNEFTVGNASGTVPSTQFLAVSNTSDVMGKYTIWSWNTTDPTTANCPCFGDFDQLGVDNNGIYIATNEFSTGGAGFNGVIIYAVSKQTLEQVANTGILPTLFRYRIKLDYFGQPYHISPASTPPGAKFATNTEYFVESNGDASTADHLAVYALRDTANLATPAPPPMDATEVQSEGYSAPPDATQKTGPIPLGNANQDPEGQVESDFDAIQEVTYTNGQLYAEASTTTFEKTVGVAWFEIAPTATTTGITATMTNQGYVRVAGQNLVYPVVSVNGAGDGYIAFSLMGPSYYPSAAYIPFTASGTSGSVHVAASGAAPEDGFTCYAAFVGPFYGGCRWGDYSMGVAMGSDIYMATEYIPPSSRDYLTNWGTFIWHAPAPTAP
jgi:hypothetical protein